MATRMNRLSWGMLMWVFLVMLFILLTAVGWANEGRIYHRILIKDIPTTIYTHVCTSGVAKIVKHERDGDIHIRVEDGNGSGAFIIGEVIPTLVPKDKTLIQIPKPGHWIEICGIVRQDRKHTTPEYPGGWFELHPVERLR